ncbi:MAG: Gfo/Idh/MocA family oxidoreductase [Rickettsiales bacterium]|jgi:predicted dehydrogenase|nr:Gfo/Idh/MocA family oxidoreductase [Rickettsiales bacterium]
MKALVVGLGSMGKRRVRNLTTNGIKDIIGYDLRQDRREEVVEKYQIKVLDNFEEAVIDRDAIIISVPPDKHMAYMGYAVDHEIPCFVEASVVDDGMDELIKKSEEKKVLICPSCTMRYLPAIKTIKKVIDDSIIGKISHFSYHSGQFLPDWHPWENVKDFYVSNPLTGGAREIVPFELTWMNWIFGDILDIKGFYEKTIDMDISIDDTYVSAIKYKSGVLGTLIVDVVSRSAVRQLIINGNNGQIIWDWNSKQVRVYDANLNRWIIYNDPEGHSEKGYNDNIIEEPYINEIKDFIDSVAGKKTFPNSLMDDHKILKVLYKLEESCKKR